MPVLSHLHHLFPGGGKDGHHLMVILSKPLGIKLRDDLIEDLGCPILDSSNDTEHDPAGDPAPGAIADPRLVFARLVTFDLTLAHRAHIPHPASGD